MSEEKILGAAPVSMGAEWVCEEQSAICSREIFARLFNRAATSSVTAPVTARLSTVKRIDGPSRSLPNASALAKRCCATPSEFVRRPPYPCSRTGYSGVQSMRATPICRSGSSFAERLSAASSAANASSFIGFMVMRENPGSREEGQWRRGPQPGRHFKKIV